MHLWRYTLNSSKATVGRIIIIAIRYTKAANLRHKHLSIFEGYRNNEFLSFKAYCCAAW
jgi:hypothetical protein